MSSFTESNKSVKTIQLREELAQIVKLINGRLQAEFGDHPDKKEIIKNYKDFSEYEKELNNIY